MGRFRNSPPGRKGPTRMTEAVRVARETVASGGEVAPARLIAARVPPKAWPPPKSPTWSMVGATREEVEALYRSLDGYVTFPGLGEYMDDRQGLEEWPMPRIIAHALSEADVRTLLAWAHERDWLISIRSGGHNTAGYHLCNGMVIDMSSWDEVTVDGNRVTAQAGVTFEHLALKLAGHDGLFVPGGTCPTVCVAGYTMGGGYSLASRRYGMCCDIVAQIRMMTWDGTVLTTSRTEHPELFWALRGGSGGQFGVLLDITYDAPARKDLWGFVLQWDLSEAAEVLDYLVEHHTWSVDNKPEPFGYLGAITALVDQNDPTKAEDKASLAILAMYVGSEAEGRRELAGLFALGNPTERYSKVAGYNVINTELFMVLPYEALGLDQASSLSASGLVAPGASVEWAEVVEMARKMPCTGNLIALEPYGGAIGMHPDSFNAFPHRAMQFDLMYDSFWNPAWTDTFPKAVNRAQAAEWLEGVQEVLAPAQTDRVYCNYAERDIVNYRKSYWSQHFGKLVRVKGEFDPKQVFRFDQSISWFPGCGAEPVGADEP